MPKTSKSTSLYLSADALAWLDSRGVARGVYVERLIERERTAEGPSDELLRLTRDLRVRLDAIDDAIAEAQDLASAIETATGIVAESGARVDDPPQ